MPSYELEGQIKKIDYEQTFDSGFTKREFVVTTDEKFPQDIKFECVKDKCSLLDDWNQGDIVKVSFNMRGNEYNEKHYVNLTAWKIEKAGKTTVAEERVKGEDARNEASKAEAVSKVKEAFGSDDNSDSLPF